MEIGDVMEIIEALRQFKDLLENEIITQEEFDNKKRELLAMDKGDGDTVKLLRGYKELLDSNVISQEEFDQKKKGLLRKETQNIIAASAVAPHPVETQTISAASIACDPVLNNSNPAASKSKTKKILIASIVAVAVAIAAILAVSILSGGNFKELPGGVKMGDSYNTVVTKANKIQSNESNVMADGIYELRDGKVYGYRYKILTFVTSNDALNEVYIRFSDSRLDLEKVEKKLSKVYGKSTVNENGYLQWKTNGMFLFAAENEGDVYVYFFQSNE